MWLQSIPSDDYKHQSDKLINIKSEILHVVGLWKSYLNQVMGGIYPGGYQLAVPAPVVTVPVGASVSGYLGDKYFYIVSQILVVVD